MTTALLRLVELWNGIATNSDAYRWPDRAQVFAACAQSLEDAMAAAERDRCSTAAEVCGQVGHIESMLEQQPEEKRHGMLLTLCAVACLEAKKLKESLTAPDQGGAI